MLLASIALAVAPPDDDGTSKSGDRPHSHINTPGEIDEEQGDLLLQMTYTGEVMANAAGGRQRGARYLDNLDLVLEADLDRIVGWTGAQAHLYGLYNNGTSISDLVGDSQTLSNIETGTRAIRLYEAWIDQKIGSRVSLRAGLYDLNSEFDALDASGLFVGSAHGMGTDFAQSGQNGPSIFPSTSFAARLEVQPAKRWVIRAAILDGVPNDPARPGRMRIRLAKDEGLLMVAEVQAPLGSGNGKLLLGHWRYTAPFDLIDGSGRRSGNAGSYIRGELPVIDRPGGRIEAFARLGAANGRINTFNVFASAGLKLSGWLPSRPDDEFGIALATATTSRQYRLAFGSTSAETAIEMTYRTKLAPWFSIQPSIQYIRQPSADAEIDDALVIGLRSEVSFNLIDR